MLPGGGIGLGAVEHHPANPHEGVLAVEVDEDTARLEYVIHWESVDNQGRRVTGTSVETLVFDRDEESLLILSRDVGPDGGTLASREQRLGCRRMTHVGYAVMRALAELGI